MFEAANFDATAIRKTATRLKKRTESSARFEKSLDPNLNTTALLRYLKLLDDTRITYTASDEVVSLGALAHDKQIFVSHALIEHKIGIAVAQERVETILTRLGFGLRVKQVASDHRDLLYEVTVPPFRSTKDVTIPEDIIEEVVRFIGYKTIPETFPTRQMRAFDTQPLHRCVQLRVCLPMAYICVKCRRMRFLMRNFLPGSLRSGRCLAHRQSSVRTLAATYYFAYSESYTVHRP